MPRKLLTTFILFLLVVTLFVSAVSASITASSTIRLYYDNGTYSELAPGTYSNLDRVDNVWYLNGAVYPAATVSEEVYVMSNTTNVDSSANLGLSSNFTAQQSGPDSINDTLTEANVGGGVVANETSNLVDNNSSNVDSHTGHGTSSSFAAQQTVDATNDTLTEANTSVAATNTTVFNNGFEVGAWNNVAFWNATTTWIKGTNSTPGSPWVTHSGTNMSYAGATNDGNLDTIGVDCSTATKIYINFWYMDDDVDTADAWHIWYWDGAAWDDIADLNSDTEDTWLHYVASTTDNQYFDNGFKIRFAAGSPDSGEACFIDDVQIIREVTPAANYEMDYEFQWTTANYTETNEELCIRTGPLNGENLYVQVWDTTWKTLMTLAANQWNNASLGGNLTSSTITFRYLGATESSDTSQSTWQIESALIHTWNITANVYRLDIEEQWTGLNYARANEELCVFAGPYTGIAENLMVNIWNTTASTWNWAMNLTTNQWNNVSVSGWLTSDTFTVQFKDGTQTSDPNQNTWNKDCALLHTWETAGAAWVNNTLTSTITLTDAAPRGIGIVTSLLQTLTLQATLPFSAKAIAYVLSGTTTLQDAASKGVSLSFTLTSLSSIMDTNTLVKELYRLSSENLQIVSSVSALNSYLKSSSGTVGLVPVLNSNIALLFTSTGNIAIIDSSSLAKELQNGLTGTLSITDLLNSGKALVVTSSGAIGIIDTSALAKALGISLSDLTQILDSSQNGLSLSQALPESIKIEDVTASLKELFSGQNVTVGQSEASTIQDVLNAVKAMEQTGTGSIGIVPLAGTGQSIIILPDGSLYLVDTSSFLKAMGITLTGNQTLQDVIEQLKALQRNGAATIQIISTTDGGKALLVSSDGTIQLVDSAVLLKALMFTPTGATAIVDSTALTKALGISKLETLELDDATSVLKELGVTQNVTLGEGQTIQDIIEALKALEFGGSEAIQIIPVGESGKAIVVLSNGTIILVDLARFLKELGFTLPNGLQLNGASTANKAIGTLILEFLHEAQVQIKDIIGAWGDSLTDLVYAAAMGDVEGAYIGIGMLSTVVACICTWIFIRRRNSLTQSKTGFKSKI